MTNFFEHLLNVLRGDDRFFSVDGILLRNAVYESAMRMDEKLLRLLLSDDFTREKFFTDIDGVKIFDKLAQQPTILARQLHALCKQNRTC